MDAIITDYSPDRDIYDVQMLATANHWHNCTISLPSIPQQMWKAFFVKNIKMYKLTSFHSNVQKYGTTDKLKSKQHTPIAICINAHNQQINTNKTTTLKATSLRTYTNTNHI